MSTTFVDNKPTQTLEPFKGVKKVPHAEYYTGGHRTCQGCESAQIMKLMAKAAGPRTIVLGATGCMYVANTSYYSTPWGLPWMHTQLGSAGSGALGVAAALRDCRDHRDDGDREPAICLDAVYQASNIHPARYLGCGASCICCIHIL